MIKDLVIIFCRTPIKGQVKRRLGKEIGEDAALRIYKKTLLRTIGEVEKFGRPFKIYYSGGDGGYFKGLTGPISISKQKNAGLGEAMYDALEREKENGFDRLVLVGSDIPEFESSDISDAFKLLDQNDLVFGPAIDGGYYLVGLKENRMDLFSGILWGEDGVLDSSLRKAQEFGLKAGLCRERMDLDTIEDLRSFPDLLNLASG